MRNSPRYFTGVPYIVLIAKKVVVGIFQIVIDKMKIFMRTFIGPVIVQIIEQNQFFSVGEIFPILSEYFYRIIF